MNLDSPLTVTLAVITLALLAFLGVKVFAAPKVVPENPFEFFMNRAEWKVLPVEFLHALADKFQSVPETEEFAQVCERSGVLRKTIKTWAPPGGEKEISYCLGATATALSSYGNSLGESEQFPLAKQAFESALRVYPNHVPTWTSLGLCEALMGNCERATYWADRVLSFQPDTTSDNPWDRTFADIAAGTGDKETREAVGKKLGIEDESVVFQGLRQQALEIKDFCSGSKDK